MPRNEWLLTVLCLFLSCGHIEVARGVDDAAATPLKSATRDKPVSTKLAPSDADVEQWITDLNAPDFHKREEATRQLIEAGTVVAEQLLEAARSSNLETTARITAILRAWMTSGRDDLIETAETALEQLAESKNRSMANRAVAVLNQYAVSISQPRALAQIKKLGGTIRAIEGIPQQVFVQNDVDSFFVILGRSWEGGEEGLKYIRRLRNLSMMYLIHNPKSLKILTPNVSPEAVAKLQKMMPQLRVQFRGPAFLGISGSARFGGSGCLVSIVQPDTPAAKAEIISGDVIVKFADKPIADFDALIDNIAEKNPGDVIKLEILRGDGNELRLYERLQANEGPNINKELLEELRKRLTKEISVTLGEWR
jgi:hypothetical protein